MPWWDGEHDLARFGWAIAGSDQAERLHGEVRELTQWVEQTWGVCFPARLGYEVGSESTDDLGIRLTVSRGDFHARVAVEGEATSPPCVRVFGGAGAQSISVVERESASLVRRLRALGVAFGLLVFLSVCVLVVGRREPFFPLSGMLMVLTLLFSLVTGGSVGTWFGERVAERRCRRTRSEAEGDEELQSDLKRFKALARLFVQQREVIASRRRCQPFRHEA
jgi:hypothetical protein